MTRWALLLLAFATPWSSPMGCGGDGCLRNSDCAADEVCSTGSCIPETPAAVAVGGEANEAGETSTPSAGTTSGGGGTAQAGSAGSATAGTAGSESNGGQPSLSEGGAAGAINDPIDEGGAGSGGALDLGGAGGLGGAP
jgi:hypothetical protein